LHIHRHSHEQIRPTEERRRVTLTVVPECDNNIALCIQQTIGIAIEQENAHFRRCRVLKITLGPQRVNIGWII